MRKKNIYFLFQYLVLARANKISHCTITNTWLKCTRSLTYTTSISSMERMERMENIHAGLSSILLFISFFYFMLNLLLYCCAGWCFFPFNRRFSSASLARLRWRCNDEFLTRRSVCILASQIYSQTYLQYMEKEREQEMRKKKRWK